MAFSQKYWQHRLSQVMESQSMIYIVSEYASQGEIFGKIPFFW